MAMKTEDILKKKRIENEREVEALAERHDEILRQFNTEVVEYLNRLKDRFLNSMDEQNEPFSQFKEDTEKYLDGQE